MIVGVVHLVLMEDGRWVASEEDAKVMAGWSLGCGGRIEFGTQVCNQGGGDRAEGAVVVERPAVVRGVAGEAAKESGASLRMRAEGCCVELGLKSTKDNVGIIEEWMDRLIQDWESLVLGWDAETEKEGDKAQCWNQLVNMIRNKGR